MNSKNFLILFGLAVIVMCFTIFGSDNTAPSSKNEFSPISDLDGTKVKEIQISNSNSDVALKNVDGKWLVANRSNYKADSSKVNGLLLKLLSTQNVQILPSSVEGLKQLGLEEGGEKNEITTKVIFIGDTGEVLSGILLGNMRPSTSSAGPGQYVRQFKSDTVMLLKSPIIAASKPENWILTELVNVLSHSLYKVETYSNSTLLFEIKRKSFLNKKPEMFLDAATPAGKVLRDAIVSQVSAGLENLGITDVSQSSSTEMAELKFDRESRFYLTNGLVYSVSTAESKDNPPAAFAKLSVSLDSKLIEELKALEAKQVISSASSVSSGIASSSSSSSSAEPLKFADEAEVVRLNQSFKDWIYKLPEYSSSKFRKNLDEFFETKTESAVPK